MLVRVDNRLRLQNNWKPLPINLAEILKKLQVRVKDLNFAQIGGFAMH